MFLGVALISIAVIVLVRSGWLDTMSDPPFDRPRKRCPGCGKLVDSDTIQNGLCGICDGGEDYPANDGG